MSDVTLQPILSKPQYFGGSDGYVYSAKRKGPPKKLGMRIGTKGYYTTKIMVNGKATCYNVHKLIAEAFLGPCPEGLQILHGPAGKLDNRPENLKYGTAQENMEDKKRDGTYQGGTKNGRSKLTDNQVREIRKLNAEGVFVVDLAKRFGLTKAAVRFIVIRKTWKYLV